MKKVLYIFVVVCILFSNMSSVFAYHKDSRVLLDSEIKSMKQAPAVDAYYLFCEAYNVNQQKRLFPEGYAGAYISEDCHLVLKILKGYDDLKYRMMQLLSGYPVVFEEGDIGCRELYALADSIYHKMQIEDVHCLTEIEVREKESCVRVGYNPIECSNEEKKAFDTLAIKNHIIVFESTPVMTASLIGGARLYKPNGASLSSYGTLGYCGTYNNQSVIITAGHVSQGVTLYFGYNNPVGTVLVENYYNYCSGDYSIIKVANTSTNPLTNTIYTSSNTTTTITSYYNGNPNALSGEQLFKYGISTGFTTGTVSGYNITTQYGSTHVQGLVSFYNSTISIVSSGDSGGPVYRVLSNGTRQAVGIISGGMANDGYHTAYMTPLWYLSGFTPKTN